MSARALIHSYTWLRDNQGLFDYESKSMLCEQLIQLDSSRWLLREGDEVKEMQLQENISDSAQALCSLNFKHGKCTIKTVKTDAKNSLQLPERLWLILKNKKFCGNRKEIRVSEGDVFKLGRAVFRIAELKGFPSERPHLFPLKCSDLKRYGAGGSSSAPPPPLQVEIQNDPSHTCRICLTEGDLLISPCNCTGTMGLIHVKCLQQWLTSKVATREHQGLQCYSWKKLECEVCKFQYPESLLVGGKEYRMLDVKRPEGKCVVIESIPWDGSNRVRYIVPLGLRDKVHFGRAHESDIRLSDISVSRSHATLIADKNGLTLRDNGSKFGSLVQLEEEVVLSSSNSIAVQCGRSVLQIQMKKQNSRGCFVRCSGKPGTGSQD